MDLSFKKPKLSFSELRLPNGRLLRFDGFWPGFNAETDFALWPQLINKYCQKQNLRILGPFWKRRDLPLLMEKVKNEGKWDLFITGESRDNPTEFAKKCIGFRLPIGPNEVRFPYWQWYLNWFNLKTNPQYLRFGEHYSIDQLMQPINKQFDEISKKSFIARPPRAVLLTSHLKRHRLSLYRQCKFSIGCDIYGRKYRPTTRTKKDLLSDYKINLCPENIAAQGYITEKIPEAFLSGCIPITYCNPADLALDFNPKAVINLFGLSRWNMRQKLKEVASDYEVFSKLRSEPLLLDQPTIDPLIELLKR